MSEKHDAKAGRQVSWIENILFDCLIRELPVLIPGVVLAAGLVAVFVWLTNLANAALGMNGLISYILVVIVAGMILRNTINLPTIFAPGISFCLKKLLKLGIMLMGIRLSFLAVVQIGIWGIPIVVVCILVGIIVTRYFGRRLGVPDRLATLIGVGTSICGCTAIVAAAPGIKARDEEITYAVANITVFGVIALIVYPYLSHWMFGGNTVMAGLFTGTAIHETAQVAASGLIYDQVFSVTVPPTTADVAMVTKLIRNAMMALVIPAMTFLYARGGGETRYTAGNGFRKCWQLFPLFILGFLFMAIIRTIGDVGIGNGGLAMGIWQSEQWSAVTAGIKEWSGYILATAMAAVGLGTSFKSIRGLGIKPFYVGLFAAVMVGVSALIMVMLLGRFVSV